MVAEAIGQPAHPQRPARYRAWRRPRRSGQAGRAQAGAGQLFGRRGRFTEKGKRLHHRVSGIDRLADLVGQGIELGPVAQAALPVQPVRSDVGLLRSQLVRATVGRAGGFGVLRAGIFQRMSQPQGNAWMCRGATAGLLQQLRGLLVVTGLPVGAAQPGQCLGMVGTQLQGALRRLCAGGQLPAVELGIGQHQPGDEVIRLPGNGLAQGQRLRIGAHQLPSARRASSSAWCSCCNRAISSSRPPSMMLGRSYRVSPSTRWSVIRPCGKL